MLFQTPTAMETVHVSTSSKALFAKVRKIVPPMLEKFHKGLFCLPSILLLRTTCPYCLILFGPGGTCWIMSSRVNMID